MTAKRVAAAVVAIALVVAAFVIRGAIDDDDPNSGPDEPVGNTTATTGPTDPSAELVCATELRAACEQLAGEFPELTVTVEAAGVTLDRLAALADPDAAPLWLTIDPFPAMVDASRGTAAPLGFGTEAVGVSRLAIAMPTGRAAVLDTGCAGVAAWVCLGDHAGDPWTDLGGESSWGTVRPSLGAVPDEAMALASFADAVAGHTGTTDFDDADWAGHIPALRALARASSRAPNSGGTPLATMATGRAVDAAATATYELAALGAPGSRYELVYPDEEMWLHAVVATPAGQAAPDGLAAAAAEHLQAAGWDPATGAPSATTLPGPAVMIDLRQLWTELT